MRPSATRRRSGASSAETSTFWLFHDARVCTSTSWPTFPPLQPISGVLSASSKHWSKRKRDGGGRGRVSQVERRPVHTCQARSTKIVCTRQTPHMELREALGFPLHAPDRGGGGMNWWSRCTNWKQGVWKSALRWSNRYLIEYLIDLSSFSSHLKMRKWNEMKKTIFNKTTKMLMNTFFFIFVNLIVYVNIYVTYLKNLMSQ